MLKLVRPTRLEPWRVSKCNKIIWTNWRCLLPLDGEREKVLVGDKIGKYKTLDEALEKVNPFTTIFLTEGVYSITEPITKPGLIIEKRDKDEHVYIIGNEGPVIKIELEQTEPINYVVFKNLTILHSGASIQFKFKENAP